MAKETEYRKLYCIREVETWGGLCAGIAYWLGISTWVVRLLMFMFIFSTFPTGLFLYILFAVLIPDAPETPEDYREICE